MWETTKNIPDGTETITICDREGDFYEFYNEAIGVIEKFVVRVVNNRVTNSREKLRSVLENGSVCGTEIVNIPSDTRHNIKSRTAKLNI